MQRTPIVHGLLLATGVSAMAHAQSETPLLDVSATVSGVCIVDTAPVNFGAYDSVVANASAALDATGTITLTCTKSVTARIDLSAGGNGQSGARRMVATASTFLTYELYKDTGRTSVWGDTAGTGMNLGAAPSRGPRTFTVYGRVPGAQGGAVGTYTDVVVATVNF